MSNDNSNDLIVLVDFGGGQMRDVADDELSDEDLEHLGGKSKEAVQNSLKTIEWVANNAKGMLDKLHNKPHQMELEFGIAVSAKAGVLVLNGESNFHIKAKLIWKNDDA